MSACFTCQLQRSQTCQQAGSWPKWRTHLCASVWTHIGSHAYSPSHCSLSTASMLETTHSANKFPKPTTIGDDGEEDQQQPVMVNIINKKMEWWGRRSTTWCSDGEEDQQQLPTWCSDREDQQQATKNYSSSSSIFFQQRILLESSRKNATWGERIFGVLCVFTGKSLGWMQEVQPSPRSSSLVHPVISW